VFNGMSAVHDGADLVCIHDAARPLVTKECVYKVNIVCSKDNYSCMCTYWHLYRH
jgi:2-C-methyl-D-erythritol 4-phosphate cytidylyltransferase